MPGRNVIRPLLRIFWRSLSSDRRFAQFLGSLVRFLDYIYPKNAHTIVFGSNNAKVMSGSPKALFESIQSRFPEFNVYYLLRNPSNHRQISPLSLNGLCTFLQAKYLVSSHGLNDFFFYRASRRKKHVSTWHGLPMKNIGLLQKGLSKQQVDAIHEYADSISAFMVASEYDAELLSRALGFDLRKKILTGHPRNDSLVDAGVQTKKKLKSILANVPNGAKVILYAPTYRVPKSDNKERRAQLFPLDDFDKESLFRFLERDNLLLLVRAHINDPISDQIPEHDRIVQFGFQIHENINTVLPEIDFLVTDYSSISYDFLLVDRPIIYIPYDLDEYSKNPGFMVDDYSSWTPGAKISLMSQFFSHIDLCLQGEDPYQEKRHELRKIIHQRQSKDSISRFVQMLGHL